MLSSYEKHVLKKQKLFIDVQATANVPLFIYFFLKENKLFVLKAENSPHIIDALMDYFKLNTIGGIRSQHTTPSALSKNRLKESHVSKVLQIY